MKKSGESKIEKWYENSEKHQADIAESKRKNKSVELQISQLETHHIYNKTLTESIIKKLKPKTMIIATLIFLFMAIHTRIAKIASENDRFDNNVLNPANA